MLLVGCLDGGEGLSLTAGRTPLPKSFRASNKEYPTPTHNDKAGVCLCMYICIHIYIHMCVCLQAYIYIDVYT